MADTLYRYDEPTGQWVEVTNINRVEVGGGSGVMCSMLVTRATANASPFVWTQSNISTSQI